MLWHPRGPDAEIEIDPFRGQRLRQIGLFSIRSSFPGHWLNSRNPLEASTSHLVEVPLWSETFIERLMIGIALLAKECIQQCSVSLVLSCQNLLKNPLCSPGNHFNYNTFIMLLRSDTSRFREEMRICIILSLPISISTNWIWDWLWREALWEKGGKGQASS